MPITITQVQARQAMVGHLSSPSAYRVLGHELLHCDQVGNDLKAEFDLDARRSYARRVSKTAEVRQLVPSVLSDVEKLVGHSWGQPPVVFHASDALTVAESELGERYQWPDQPLTSVEKKVAYAVKHFGVEGTRYLLTYGMVQKKGLLGEFSRAHQDNQSLIMIHESLPEEEVRLILAHELVHGLHDQSDPEAIKLTCFAEGVATGFTSILARSQSLARPIGFYRDLTQRAALLSAAYLQLGQGYGLPINAKVESAARKHLKGRFQTQSSGLPHVQETLEDLRRTGLSLELSDQELGATYFAVLMHEKGPDVLKQAFKEGIAFLGL